MDKTLIRYHNPWLRFSPLWALNIRSSFPLELKFNLFSVAFVLMFSIKYLFGWYLDSYACYLDFELLSPSEEVEIPESIQIRLFPKQINRIHSFRIVRRSGSDCLPNKIREIQQKPLFLMQQTVISRDCLRRFLLDQFNIGNRLICQLKMNVQE